MAAWGCKSSLGFSRCGCGSGSGSATRSRSTVPWSVGRDGATGPTRQNGWPRRGPRATAWASGGPPACLGHGPDVPRVRRTGEPAGPRFGAGRPRRGPRATAWASGGPAACLGQGADVPRVRRTGEPAGSPLLRRAAPPGSAGHGLSLRRTIHAHGGPRCCHAAGVRRRGSPARDNFYTGSLLLDT